jgi:hypothetical protein
MNYKAKYTISQHINQKNFFPFLLIPTEKDLGDMTRLERAIYLFLTNQCHDYRSCRISQISIANIVKCHEKTACRLMGVLQRKRFIMGFFNGFNKTKTYVVSEQFLDKEIRKEMAPWIPALNLHIYDNVTLLRNKIRNKTKKQPKKKTFCGFSNRDHNDYLTWEDFPWQTTWGPPES